MFASYGQTSNDKNILLLQLVIHIIIQIDLSTPPYFYFMMFKNVTVYVLLTKVSIALNYEKYCPNF